MIHNNPLWDIKLQKKVRLYISGAMGATGVAVSIEAQHSHTADRNQKKK
jgi:GTP cyclohydrolase I